MPRPIVHPAFRRVFGDAFADFIEGVAEKKTKSKIDSVGRTSAELQRQTPQKPVEEAEHWLDKLDK